MGNRGAAVLFLLCALARAEDPPPFPDLSDAAKTVAKLARSTRDLLLAEDRFVPDTYFEATREVAAAEAARKEGQEDQARAAYRKAWTLFSGCEKESTEQKRALEALREKKPPELKLGFKEKKAVSQAMEWLARHQDATGRWDAAGFMKHDPDDDQCDGPGGKLYDVGVTALALLAFLEGGFGDRESHYALEVHRGLNWLLLQQDAKGVFGPRETNYFHYNHALATLALAKASAMSKDPRFAQPLKDAVAYILHARSKAKGVWRYDDISDEADTSITTWCFRALIEAERAGIEVEIGPARDGVEAWLTSMTMPDGRIGYNYQGEVARPQGMEAFPADRSRAMTAAGVVAITLLHGEEQAGKRCGKQLEQILSRPPLWSTSGGDIDLYYWYYGTLACALDRKAARAWKKPLEKAVLKNQHGKGSGARAGSWDPIGAWGKDGGRVYATAILTLTLIHAG